MAHDDKVLPGNLFTVQAKKYDTDETYDTSEQHEIIRDRITHLNVSELPILVIKSDQHERDQYTNQRHRGQWYVQTVGHRFKFHLYNCSIRRWLCIIDPMFLNTIAMIRMRNVLMFQQF